MTLILSSNEEEWFDPKSRKVAQQIARNRLQRVGRKSCHGCELCLNDPLTAVVMILR